MKSFLFSLFMFLSNYSICQQLNWVKEHELIDNGFHFGNNVGVDKEGNIYCSSIFRGIPYEQITVSGSYLRKYSKQGVLIWDKFIGKSEDLFGLATDKNGNSYITGTFFRSLNFGCNELFDSTQRPMFLAKLDSNGNCLWSKMIINAYGGKIAMDKSGQAIYIIGGNSMYGTSFGCPSPQTQGFHFISKYDTDGNCMWLQPTLTWNYISGLAVNDNYVAVTGRFNYFTYMGIDSSHSIGKQEENYIDNIYTALYDLDGNLKWAKVTGDYSDDVEPNSIALDDSNNVYVTGNFYNNVNLAGRHFSVLQWKDIFLVKYNEQGDTVLTTTWPGTTSEEGRVIYANKDGIYFSGVCTGQVTIGDTTINPGKVSIVLAKMSFDLKKTEWLKTFSSNGPHSEIFQITSDSDNNIIAVGDYTYDLQVDNIHLTYGNGYKKPFVLSIKELDQHVISVPENPSEFTSVKIYPNPTGNSINIACSGMSCKQLSLSVKNTLGQTVYSITESNISNEYKKTIDLSKEKKGIYFIEIIADEKRSVKKIILE
jgi:hypothetical protein